MSAVIFNQDQALFNLFWGHLFNDLLKTDRRIRIATYGRQGVPSVAPYKVRSRHATADLVVPADTRLCARMATQTRAQIPFEGANVVAFNASAQRIHATNQLFCFGVAGLSHGVKYLVGLLVLPAFHHIFRILNIDSQDRS